MNLSEKTDLFLKELFPKGYEISSLEGDAGHRKYFRINSENKKYILLEQESFDPNKESFLNVQSYLIKNSIPAPKSHAIRGDKGIILLDDLGSQRLQDFVLENQEKDYLTYYKRSVDHLIKMQFKSKEDKTCFAFSLFFDQKLFLEEFKFAFFYLSKLLNLNYDLKDLISFYEKASKALDSKNFFCHKDYHSRNLMLKDKEVFVIDFQDALLGPVFYDLVSLIHDGYVPLGKDFKEKILNYYLDQAKEFFPEIKNEYEKNYLFQVIQRTFKACGSFASFKYIKNDSTYFKYLPQNLELILKIMETSFEKEKVFISFLKECLEKAKKL